MTHGHQPKAGALAQMLKAKRIISGAVEKGGINSEYQFSERPPAPTPTHPPRKDFDGIATINADDAFINQQAQKLVDEYNRGYAAGIEHIKTIARLCEQQGIKFRFDKTQND